MVNVQKREICKNCGTEITNRPHYLAYLVETGGVEKVCSLCRVRLRGHKKRSLCHTSDKGILYEKKQSHYNTKRRHKQ